MKMNPGKKDTSSDPGVAAAPSTIATIREYYLMIRSPSKSSDDVPSYNKHVLPLDPRVQFQTNSSVDTLDEHQVAAIENVLRERNARTADVGEWILAALSVTEGSKSGSFKFMISFCHSGLSPDFRETYPIVVEAGEGAEKETNANQHDLERESVKAESSIPGPMSETSRTGDGQQQPSLKFPNSEGSDLASARFATPSAELDSRSSTPIPRETRTQTEIQMDELDVVEDLACKTLESLRDQSRLHPDRKKAIDVLSRVLEARKKLIGREHPKALMTVVHLAHNGHPVSEYSHCGTAAGVMAILDAYDGLNKVLGENHPDTLTAMHALAIAYERCGDDGTAVDMFGYALKGRAEVLGKTHEDTLDSMNCLVRVRDRLGWQGCKEEAMESLFECQKEVLGKTHAATLITMEHVANIHARDNLLDEADACMTLLLERRKEASDARDPALVRCMCSLADIRLKRLQY